MPVRVVNSQESGALDSAAIASGIPSRALMRAAAFNAATVIVARFPAALRRGATVFTGPGNNGGDGWALARALDSAGVTVRVREVVAARTPDAIAEREFASHLIDSESPPGGVVIDAMLGTGNTGALRGAILAASKEIARARHGGSTVVALDLPTGVDATSGAGSAPDSASVTADLTISFGSCKRGTLVTRAACGEIVVVDIGISGQSSNIPTLVDAAFVRDNVPRIAPDSNKGTRRKVAIIAGARNMGGAAILAATGALRSGAGLVKVITAPENIPPVHARLPEALAAPLAEADSAIAEWADAVLIGPGLGRDDATKRAIHATLQKWRGPIVVDADALNAFDGDLEGLGAVLRGRPAIITPHPGEMSRLVGRDIQYVLDRRFDVGVDVARAMGATVLLKGTPTVVTDPAGERYVVASGTAALATGGSGDALGGMVATLLAQECEPALAASCAAWAHGRASELTPGIRGFRLMDVLARLPQAWSSEVEVPRYPVMATLPALA